MDMSLVGERFAQARASKGTQEGFARELGVGVRVLQRWEAGEVMPRWKTFVSFLQLTEVSADWLLGLSEEGGPSNRDQAHAAGESAKKRVSEARRKLESRPQPTPTDPPRTDSPGRKGSSRKASS